MPQLQSPLSADCVWVRMCAHHPIIQILVQYMAVFGANKCSPHHEHPRAEDRDNPYARSNRIYNLHTGVLHNIGMQASSDISCDLCEM